MDIRKRESTTKKCCVGVGMDNFYLKRTQRIILDISCIAKHCLSKLILDESKKRCFNNEFGKKLLKYLTVIFAVFSRN